MSKYVLVDLEMCNIPILFRKYVNDLKREIIQIGAVMLDENFEMIDQFMTYVCPKYGQIDKEINLLTGIARKDIEDAPNVFEALNAFVSWLPSDAILVSWSENDVIQVEDEIDEKELDIPQLEPYLETWEDCQITFSDKMRTSKIYRLSEALRISGIELETSEHDALVDAKNTAKLFIKMKKEKDLVLNSYYSISTENKEPHNNPFVGLLTKICFEN